jgi:hypothetical protein
MYLIDNAGRLVRSSQRLQTSFGTRLPTAEFADFLVRNLGWLSLATKQLRCELRFRPSKANDPALLTAVNKIRSLPSRRFTVTWFDGGWQSDSFTTSAQAVTLVMSLAGTCRAQARQSDFLCRPHRSDHLSIKYPLHRVLDAWSSGERDVIALAALADQLADGRYIIAGPNDIGDLSIFASGRDFNIIGECWLSRVPTLRIADWPDVAFGSWVERAYRSAWNSEAPQIDDLDCFIEWPQLGRVRHSYSRVILPCRSASGARLLLGVMQYDPLIDLRAQIH